MACRSASTAVSDGTMAETRHAAHVVVTHIERGERGDRAVAPRDGGVVLEPLGRGHAVLVRHARRRDDVAVAVGGDAPSPTTCRCRGRRSARSSLGRAIAASTSSCNKPFVATALPPSARATPSRSVNRPPAASTTTIGAARSQIDSPFGSTAMSIEPSATNTYGQKSPNPRVRQQRRASAAIASPRPTVPKRSGPSARQVRVFDAPDLRHRHRLAVAERAARHAHPTSAHRARAPTPHPTSSLPSRSSAISVAHTGMPRA